MTKKKESNGGDTAGRERLAGSRDGCWRDDKETKQKKCLSEHFKSLELSPGVWVH